jgi:hypothetical protein
VTWEEILDRKQSWRGGILKYPMVSPPGMMAYARSCRGECHTQHLLVAETLPASGSANIVTDLAGIRLAVRLDFYGTYERNGNNW